MPTASTEMFGQQGDTASRTPVSVRVPALNYLVLLLLSSFLGAFLIYLELGVLAACLLALAWGALPVTALTDRVVFDGRRLRRTGILPRAWARLTATRDRIKLSDIEMVQSTIVRTIKRGCNHFYTYRTTLQGKGKVYVVHSNHRNYAAFIRAVLPKLDPDILDRRTIELRDHFSERGFARARARAAKIPSSDILEDALAVVRRKGRLQRDDSNPAAAAFLHSVANQLRISGLLPQAVEAFRRATRHSPRDPILLFDFALCLNTFAAVRNDFRVERRARALMRLAERRAGADPELLARMGESYFQFGDWNRAGSVFRRAAERAGSQFRALVGLAEVALHEGKIAHVIHNFTAAAQAARTPAMRRWTRHELEYFSRLQEDEEYMELEISRLGLIESLESFKRSSLRIAPAGFAAIALGLLIGDYLIANIGWTVSIISLAVWSAAILGINTLSSRLPYDRAEG